MLHDSLIGNKIQALTEIPGLFNFQPVFGGFTGMF